MQVANVLTTQTAEKHIKTEQGAISEENREIKQLIDEIRKLYEADRRDMRQIYDSLGPTSNGQLIEEIHKLQSNQANAYEADRREQKGLSDLLQDLKRQQPKN